MAKRIEVLIPRQGISQGKRHLSFEAKGFAGQTCQAATKFLEVLGAVVSDEPTTDLYATEAGVEHLKEGNGE